MMKEAKNKNRSLYYIVMIICCCGIQISQAGIANCMGLFYRPMAEEFGIGMAGISATQTIRMLIGGVLGLFVAFLYSRIGMRACVITGCSLIFLATLGQSFATGPAQLVIFAVMEGIARGLMGTFLIKMVITNWFDDKQGTAFGLAACSSGVFGAVFNPVLGEMIQKMGWRKAMFALAFIAIACMLPAMIFMRLTPAEYGLRAYGSREDEPEEEKRSEKPEEKKTSAPKTKLHIDLGFVLTVLLGYLTSICAPLMNHMASFAETLGHSTETAAFMVSAMMVGNLFFKLILGALCDRIGALNTALMGYGTLLVSVLLFMFGKGTLFGIIAAFLYGICYGLSLVAVTQYTNRLFPRNEYARYYSIYLFFTQVLGSFNQTVVGFMYDVTGSYASILRLSILFIAMAVVLILTLERITRLKERALSRLYTEEETA